MAGTSSRARCLMILLVLSFASAAASQESAPESRGAADTRPAPESGPWDVAARHGPVREVSFTTTSGTWMNLDVSPDGREIVFDLLGDLYTVPIEGGAARLLRGGVPFDVQPRYSPDGRFISFTSDAGGGDNIWVMDRNGGSARQVTKESFRLLNNAVWTPDSRYLVARKHFTSGRSLGAGEMWMYHLAGGDGVQLTVKRTEQKDAGEPCVSPDGRFLDFSEDMTPGSDFEYNKDPHAGIYAIRRLDLQNGRLRTLVEGPGGAARPQVSPDGRTLAFVSRVRFATALCLLDLETGRVRRLFQGLSRDQQETWAIFGVYPGFAWLPDGSALVVWARGGLSRIDAQTGEESRIPFSADVRLEVAETLRFPVRVGGADFPVRVTRWPDVSPSGDRVAFTALGHTWVKDLPSGAPRRLTAVERFEYAPRFSPDGRSVVQATWDDAAGSAVEIVDAATGAARVLVSGRGHCTEPVFSADGGMIAWRETTGDDVKGRLRAARAGIWIMSVTGGAPRLITESGAHPAFTADGRRLLVQRGAGDGTELVAIDIEDRRETVLASGRSATEYALSPDERHLAFTEFFHAYVVPFPASGRNVSLSAGMKSLPVARLSADAGEFLSFSADGTRVRWHHAHELSEARLATLFPEAGATLPPDPPKGVSRADTTWDLGFTAAADIPPTEVVFTNATLVTMRGAEVIRGGRLHVRGDRIVALGTDVAPPDGVRTVDLGGGVVVPGFVDIHAHMPRGSLGQSPRQSWPLLANLAFGVTTTHDPSADTKAVFAESELVRAGLLTGPRVYSTGTILYGAEGSFKAVIDSLDDALSHLRRLRAFGAFSVKSYNQPRRNQRQQVVAAARSLGMMVVPEGGSTFFHNLNQIVDGHTTIEHALPVAPIHDDVVQLFARSGTAYTPTLVVGYGGLWGENWWYQHTDVFRNERLRRFVPASVVDPRSLRRILAPEEDFHHIDIAKGVADVVRAGGLAEIGAHGQMQGIGVHWEMWMFAQGGLPPHETLRAATWMGARAIGLDGEIGSLEPGKLADLVIYPPDRDPLVRIRDTEHLRFVMKGGRLYDAETLDQILPEPVRLPPGPDLTGLAGEPLHGPTCPCR